MKPLLYLRFLFCVLFLSPSISVFAQGPIIKVDLNQSGRQESETNEPGYTAWIISGTNSANKTISGVNFKFTKLGSIGTQLSSDWYKAGIQSPYYARLVNDGVTVKDGNSGGQIELRISGLPAGTHTLLTYHNTVQSATTNTFSPIDISLNGSQVVNDLIPTNRVTINTAAKTNFLTFTAIAGQDVVIVFSAETSGSENVKNVIINGFELNTPNLTGQAKVIYPDHRDEHVDADSGNLTLIWSPAADAVKHELYFGQDSASVATADHASSMYKGQITDTFFNLSGFYSGNTYYWRVDEVNGSAVVTKGNIWYFRPRQIAFDGAGGYGRYARGGRGGVVVEVTNLNDSGPGSFREAVTNNIGPRTIVFAVSGVIELKSRLTLNNPYVTIAGQTAPGKGICIIKAPFGMSGAHDVIVQNVRVRLGKGTTYDGMGLSGSDHAIIDHCSISWTIDEAFSSRGAHNITLQRTLISEALNVAGHQNYPAGTAHGYAASIGGDVGSFHHNLLAHCSGRNWSLAGGLDGNGDFAGRLDIFNNVVYNWDNRTTDGGAHEVNFTNNYYKKGAAFGGMKWALNAQFENFPGTQRYYFAGNVMPGVFDTTNQTDGRKYTGTPQGYNPWVSAPFFPSMAEQQNAVDAYKYVLSDVGCTQPVFDEHDIRMIEETRDSTYHYVGSVSGKKGLPDDENDVGGLESYPEIHRAADFDSDHDGLPNWWEAAIGTNTNSTTGDFSDANADDDKDGYTNIDDYLMWMAAPHYFIDTTNVVTINLKQYTRGYTAQPAYSVVATDNGVASLQDSILKFSGLKPGFSTVTFAVQDGEGSRMERKINFYGENEMEVPGVYIATFAGQRQDERNALLSWSTIDEQKTAYFELLRSDADTINFAKVSQVATLAATGNMGTLNYSYTDTNTNTSTTYYRLLRRRADSTEEMSNIVAIAGVVEKGVDPRIFVGPNPSDGKITISLTQIDYTVSIAIYDLAGKTIQKQELNGNGTYNINILVPGIYMVKLVNKTTGEHLQTQKIVVKQ